jgi:Protein of unknown function (DUF4230)
MPTGLREPESTLELPTRGARDSRPSVSRIAVVLAVVVVLTGLLFAGVRNFDLIPGFANPFGHDDIDRSEPTLLLALDDLSEYHAATGTFQVVLDLERDTHNLPAFIAGDRTVFLATGTVDATVDFTDLTGDAVRVSEDGRAVRLELPAPRLGPARVDPDASRVLARDRGLLDRLGSVFTDNPAGERQFFQLAERELTTAAANSELLRRAEDNTRQTLTAMMKSLGFAEIEVVFYSAAEH